MSQLLAWFCKSRAPSTQQGWEGCVDDLGGFYTPAQQYIALGRLPNRGRPSYQCAEAPYRAVEIEGGHVLESALEE